MTNSPVELEAVSEGTSIGWIDSVIRDDEIGSLRTGDIIYECEYGANIETRLLSDPVETGEGYEGRRQWQWKAENTQNGNPIDYLLTESLSHYGPRLYRTPQYGYYADGEWKSPLIGAALLSPTPEDEVTK